MEDVQNTDVVCIFIGNAHDFSEQALKLATVSINNVTFKRLSSIEDLLTLETDRPDRVRCVILNQSMADPMLALMGKIQERFQNTTVALAYRRPNVARQVFTQITTAMPQGGPAFLPMNRDMDCWLTVLRLLLCGENYIPSELLFAQLTEKAEREAKSENVTPVAKPKARKSSSIRKRLTDRESEVLSCVAEGKQNKLIANRLGVSEHTVKLHIHHVISKLGVNNRTEAAVWFLENHKTAQMTQ